MLATSQNNLAETLFGHVGEWVTVGASSGIVLKCKYCDMVIGRIVEDCLVLTDRHGVKWHTNVISLLDIGYVKHA